MIETKLFTGKVGGSSFSAVHDYEDFIEANQLIDIISVNVFSHNYILLTYKV